MDVEVNLEGLRACFLLADSLGSQGTRAEPGSMELENYPTWRLGELDKRNKIQN